MAMSTKSSATAAWIAAAVTALIGLSTLTVNIWIASRQRQLSAKQPLLEQSAVLAQQRDARIRTLIEIAEIVRTRCWEAERILRNADLCALGKFREELRNHADLLRGDAQLLKESWAPLRSDMSNSEHDRLLVRRIECMEALDSLMTSIALTVHSPLPSADDIRDSIDSLDRSASTFA
jgi:hypothetical protein